MVLQYLPFVVHPVVLHLQMQNILGMLTVKEWHKFQFSTTEQHQASGQSEHERNSGMPL
jgi:hypothetical protein